MTRPSRREYAAVQRERDLAATRAEKGTLLNEVVAVTGLHRKAAIRLLRRPPRAPTARSRAGRPPVYQETIPFPRWLGAVYRRGRRGELGNGRTLEGSGPAGPDAQHSGAAAFAAARAGACAAAATAGGHPGEYVMADDTALWQYGPSMLVGIVLAHCGSTDRSAAQ